MSTCLDVMLHTEVYMVYVAVHIAQGYTQPANDCQTVKPVQSLIGCMHMCSSVVRTTTCKYVEWTNHHFGNLPMKQLL